MLRRWRSRLSLSLLSPLSIFLFFSVFVSPSGCVTHCTPPCNKTLECAHLLPPPLLLVLLLLPPNIPVHPLPSVLCPVWPLLRRRRRRRRRLFFVPRLMTSVPSARPSPAAPSGGGWGWPTFACPHSAVDVQRGRCDVVHSALAYLIAVDTALQSATRSFIDWIRAGARASLIASPSNLVFSVICQIYVTHFWDHCESWFCGRLHRARAPIVSDQPSLVIVLSLSTCVVITIWFFHQ